MSKAQCHFARVGTHRNAILIQAQRAGKEGQISEVTEDICALYNACLSLKSSQTGLCKLGSCVSHGQGGRSFPSLQKPL